MQGKATLLRKLELRQCFSISAAHSRIFFFIFIFYTFNIFYASIWVLALEILNSLIWAQPGIPGLLVGNQH